MCEVLTSSFSQKLERAEDKERMMVRFDEEGQVARVLSCGPQKCHRATESAELAVNDRGVVSICRQLLKLSVTLEMLFADCINVSSWRYFKSVRKERYR